MIKQNLGAILRRQEKKKATWKWQPQHYCHVIHSNNYYYCYIYIYIYIYTHIVINKLLLILLNSLVARFYSLSFITCYLFLDAIYFSIMITFYYYINTRVSFNAEKIISVIRSRRQLVFGIDEIPSLNFVYIIKLINWVNWNHQLS